MVRNRQFRERREAFGAAEATVTPRGTNMDSLEIIATGLAIGVTLSMVIVFLV
jgi:hypothetical protein